MDIVRCSWASKPLDIAYHDDEWGVPSHDDRHLFEMIVLEGAQAGLSWSTILQRRLGYRAAFDNFEIDLVAEFDEERKAALFSDSRIIRNRAKIASAVANARAVQRLQAQYGSLDAFLWRYVDGKPIINGWTGIGPLPASTPLSDQISRDLKKSGLNFVGSTICYAFMQAVGLVNDHAQSCFRYKTLTEAS